MEQANNKNGKLMIGFIVFAILFIVVVGVAYAFFNYTRTGTANVIRTGSINFNTEEGDTVTLSDLFPIQNTGNITSSTPGVGSLSIHVTGDTTYEEGLEYLVKAVNVTSAGNHALPISIEISYEANNNKTIGTEDADYYTNRGGNSSIYKVLSTDTITDDGDIVVGYIAPGQTGIDGNIVINAYLDAANIAITDTIENGAIAVPGYDNGTSTGWIDNRAVFTTEEWNALKVNGVSFQIKVEANEGVWVTEPVEPVPTIPSCPGCKFMYATNFYQYGGANNANATVVSTLTGVTDDYTTLNRNYFLGFTETQDGKIDRAFACGIKGTDNNGDVNEGTAFCIEGAVDNSKYNDNVSLITGPTLWNDADFTAGRCVDNTLSVTCNGSVEVFVGSNGDAHVNTGSGGCYAVAGFELACG